MTIIRKVYLYLPVNIGLKKENSYYIIYIIF